MYKGLPINEVTLISDITLSHFLVLGLLYVRHEIVDPFPMGATSFMDGPNANSGTKKTCFIFIIGRSKHIRSELAMARMKNSKC